MHLNAKQREAILMLQDMRRRYPDETWDGAACGDSTYYALGTTWPALINWRTAAALERRELVTIHRDHDGWDITLTAEGVALEVTR